jgi:hypothetical protein
MIRVDPTNVDAFINIIGVKNCESAVDMALLNNKRTNAVLFKACRIVRSH